MTGLYNDTNEPQKYYVEQKAAWPKEYIPLSDSTYMNFYNSQNYCAVKEDRTVLAVHVEASVLMETFCSLSRGVAA